MGGPGLWKSRYLCSTKQCRGREFAVPDLSYYIHSPWWPNVHPPEMNPSTIKNSHLRISPVASIAITTAGPRNHPAEEEQEEGDGT